MDLSINGTSTEVYFEVDKATNFIQVIEDMMMSMVLMSGGRFLSVLRSIISYGLYLIYKVFVSVAEFGYWSAKKCSLSFGHRLFFIAHLQHKY
ncbi:hypothetical protein CTI12_AA001620 [Artemisia annua]|uniref:Transmembrane protein n=1 Tax=Artemisia annua TaxID=35608 RepID=A0A2U1QPG6_ARTAN|nr:hypothetical protein CTI12_AA001620 [Artemisia annua]